jgi:hypothetical protein
MRDVLLDRRTRERGLINAAAVERLLDAHRDGTVNGGDAIWALLNFELWFRTFIDGEGIQSLAEPARGESRTHESRITNPESPAERIAV